MSWMPTLPKLLQSRWMVSAMASTAGYTLPHLPPVRLSDPRRTASNPFQRRFLPFGGRHDRHVAEIHFGVLAVETNTLGTPRSALANCFEIELGFSIYSSVLRTEQGRGNKLYLCSTS